MKHEANGIEYQYAELLAGSYELDSRPMLYFSTEVLNFLAALSDKIRRLPREASGDELRSLAFWLRRAHLLELKKTYIGSDRLGLGITFHIAPANVPMMFAYSCFIGLLAGNSCRVRLSGRRTRDAALLCELIETVLKEPDFVKLRQRISILSYAREHTALTELFSRKCDVRIIWGGDHTVEAIRAIPLNPLASELVFPDRHSIAVFGAEAVLSLSPEDLKILADRFYNDTYAMDQNACSCPRLLFWREETAKAGQQAADRFWSALGTAAKRYELPEIKISQKYGALWELAESCTDIRQLKRYDNRLYVLEEAAIPKEVPAGFLKYGTFLEYHMKRETDWIAAVSARTQTLSYFGVPPESLRAAISERRLSGIYRIVPVGQALEMDLVWDGKDLIRCLSRPIP